jgi:large subunit ribosomal protein L29
MKARDIKELHTKNAVELTKMLSETRESLTNARLELQQQKLTNTASLTNFRRDIARIQTVLQIKSAQVPVGEEKIETETKQKERSKSQVTSAKSQVSK